MSLVLLALLLLMLLAFLGLTIQNLQLYQPLASACKDELTKITVCIPARNEAGNISSVVECVLNQSYANLELIVLDDCSTDGTAELALAAAGNDPRFRLISGNQIQPGWAGKCHACAQLSEAAVGDAILFIDADTRPLPHLVVGLVDKLHTTKAALISGFPRQITGTLSEALVLPMLQSLVITFLPLNRLNADPSPAIAAACGQVLLVKTEEYRSIGGHGAIKGSFHDGLQLARQFKRAGKVIHLCDLSDAITCRMYHGWQQVWDGFTRNAYEGLGSPAALITMVGAIVTLFVLPLVALVATVAAHAPHKLQLLAASCALLSFILRAVQAKRFGHWLSVTLTPVSALLLVVIQIASAFRKSSNWKGRNYTSDPVDSSQPVSSAQS